MLRSLFNRAQYFDRFGDDLRANPVAWQNRDLKPGHEVETTPSLRRDCPLRSQRTRTALSVDVADGVEHAVGGAPAVLGYLTHVLGGDFTLVIGQTLEPGEGVVQLVLGQQQAQLFKARAQGAPS